MWLKLHRYLGLGLGLVFVLLGLTGSYNVFMHALDEIWNPELVIKDPGTVYRPMQEILNTVRRSHPELTGPWLLQMPRHRAGMLTAVHALAPGQTGMFYNARLVSVDPYRARIIKSRDRRETVMGWIFDLHCALLLGNGGHNAVGIFGACFLFSVSTGLVLWWPSRNRLRQAFTVKQRASSERLIFDLHKVFGIYAAPVLLILAFSGFYLIYSDPVRLAVNRFSPVPLDPWADLPNLASKPLPGAETISADAAVAAAKTAFPTGELQQLRTPPDASGVYTVRLRQPGEANHFWPSSAAYIDQYNGKIIATRDPFRFSNGETFLNLQYPLHSGEALGLPGRILICVTGLIPLLLFVTGLIRWRHKTKAAAKNGRTTT